MWGLCGWSPGQAQMRRLGRGASVSFIWGTSCLFSLCAGPCVGRAHTHTHIDRPYTRAHMVTHTACTCTHTPHTCTHTHMHTHHTHAHAHMHTHAIHTPHICTYHTYTHTHTYTPYTTHTTYHTYTHTHMHTIVLPNYSQCVPGPVWGTHTHVHTHTDTHTIVLPIVLCCTAPGRQEGLWKGLHSE